jgi:hypothetical protein
MFVGISLLDHASTEVLQSINCLSSAACHGIKTTDY